VAQSLAVAESLPWEWDGSPPASRGPRGADADAEETETGTTIIILY